MALQKPISPEGTAALDFLKSGKIDVEGLVPWGSNYTFLVTIRRDGQQLNAIYKPSRGERPLWDFPDGTLAFREVAAYLVSAALGFPNVPPTILRDGPQGIGMVQLFVDMVDGQHFFTLREEHRDEMKRIAVFDAIINNTDRKGGHVLLGEDGKLWCIDHGVTFHEHPKLRTVIWDYVDQKIPASIIADLRRLREQLGRTQSLGEALTRLLTPREIKAFTRRIDALIETPVFPQPSDDWPPVPWPPV
jgi:uncharacterized repeat protein (TIGR03843 family)